MRHLNLTHPQDEAHLKLGPPLTIGIAIEGSTPPALGGKIHLGMPFSVNNAYANSWVRVFVCSCVRVFGLL